MTDKTELSVTDLFGLEYWPALPAFLISTADEAGTPHLAPYSLVFFPSYTNVTEDKDTPKVISLVIGITVIPLPEPRSTIPLPEPRSRAPTGISRIPKSSSSTCLLRK